MLETFLAAERTAWHTGCSDPALILLCSAPIRDIRASRSSESAELLRLPPGRRGPRYDRPRRSPDLYRSSVRAPRCYVARSWGTGATGVAGVSDAGGAGRIIRAA